jgi:hypothetical protein
LLSISLLDIYIPFSIIKIAIQVMHFALADLLSLLEISLIALAIRMNIYTLTMICIL